VSTITSQVKIKILILSYDKTIYKMGIGRARDGCVGQAGMELLQA